MKLFLFYLGCAVVFLCIGGNSCYEMRSDEELLKQFLENAANVEDDPPLVENDVDFDEINDEAVRKSSNDPWFMRSFVRYFRRNRRKKQCRIPKECKISLPQHNDNKCRAANAKDILIAKQWYKITKDGQQSTIKFPYKYYPWLNQTLASIGYYYITDPDEGRYFGLFKTWQQAMASMRDKFLAAFKSAPFFTYAEYQKVYYAFDAGIKALGRKEYFGSFVDSPNWFNPITNNRWEDDDVYTKLLFVNNCPWAVKKVTVYGHIGQKASTLYKQLNKAFDFTKALTEALGFHMTLEQAVYQNRLYSLYHPDYNDVVTIPDYSDKNASDTRVLRNATSPITLFVLNDDNELKIVAIQIDYKPESSVYSPKSTPKQKWLLAKGIVSQAHQDVCQVIDHLGSIHFVGAIFCLSYRRNFGKKHPIYQIMKHHCEGTVPHITTAYAALAFPHTFGHKLFTPGHTGIGEFVKISFDRRQYGEYDFEHLLKTHGINDRSIKYHPFRDDGRLIYDELKLFADQFVDLYYDNNHNVRQDTELQSFANEVSADGKEGPNAGLGKFIGFPAEFKTKNEVKYFIRQFLWQIAAHALMNYNLAPTYQPIRPIKLYEDVHPQADTYAYNLADSDVTVGISFFSDLLSHFRANRMMDYFDDVHDKKLHDLVRETHHRLHTCVQRKLSSRNDDRKARGEPTFQVIEPAWLTNSVHI